MQEHDGDGGRETPHISADKHKRTRRPKRVTEPAQKKVWVQKTPAGDIKPSQDNVSQKETLSSAAAQLNLNAGAFDPTQSHEESKEPKITSVNQKLFEASRADSDIGFGRGRRGRGEPRRNPQGQDGNQESRGGARNRGARNNQGGQDGQNNHESCQQDQRGQRGQEGRRKKEPEYFEEKKRQAQRTDQETSELVNEVKVRQNKQIIQNTEEVVQQRGKRGGQFKSVKNIGSAANYIEDEQKFAAPEKVQFVQKRNKEQNQAKIKYNFKDFLSQFQSLTEQCCFYVKSLAQGTQECIICQNLIYQRSALWNCQQCYTPFHLGCIKRWIQKLNKPLNEVVRDQQLAEEERKESSDEDDAYTDEAAKKMLAFFSWTCPNCNYAYAENKMPSYYCYCQRFSEPEFDPLILPHSCGEYCEKKKNKDCTHDVCDILCHPGACPPCNINVPVECHCSKQSQRVPCHVAKRTKFSCQQPCLKTLNCKLHQCQKVCHEGPCQPCDVLKVVSCFCGNQSQETLCGTTKYSCKQTCGKTLDCGLHDCVKTCHSDKCAPCPKDPQRVKYCPSGHNTIEKLLGKQRKSCTDPIPTCNALCERFLPCGKHQCVKVCHNDDCMKCEQPAIRKCGCGKEQKKLPCYQVDYPMDKKEKLMSLQEISAIEGFKCQKVCNRVKNCQKHKCTEICCDVKKELGRAGDPEGKHRCTIVCDKKLACGKHQCTDLCHLGYCKPCQWVSVKPVFCPCNIAKLEPPVKCGQPLPTCGGPCKQVLSCGHPCGMKCHSGNCAPCLFMVSRLCNCGKEMKNGVFCKEGTHSCGLSCDTELECGHKCTKVCHTPGQCIISREDLLLNGCAQRCGKERLECSHKCQAPCHPGKECPKTPCEAEIRLFCKCSHRWVQVICKSISERPPIECDSRCWKLQRDEKIASAFGSAQDFKKNKDSIKFEYYPEEAISFAQENMVWAKKIESQLTYCVLNKSSKSYASLSGPKRSYLGLLVYEHFQLDMCSYGQQGQKRTTDVFWREGCKVPAIMCSEIADLINQGIEEVRHESDKTTIFEASIYISNVAAGYNIDTLKKFLVNFKNEMYTEKGKGFGQFSIHFYQKQRARDALSFIQNLPNQFTNCQLVEHRRDTGTPTSQAAEEEKMQKRGKKMIEQDDGFTKVTR